MPHRLQQRQGRARRKTFTDRVLGMSPDSSIGALKGYLHAARLTDTPTEKLDLVVLEDADHLAELLAREGIPLARDDMDAYAGVMHRRVTLHIPLGWGLPISGLLLLNLVDDLMMGLLGIDVFPWF